MKDVFERMDTKKMILIVGGIVGVVVIFYLLSLVGNNLFSKNSYSDVENIMKNAAIKYYQNNSDELPNHVGNTLSVSDSELESSKYMKNISKYIKEDGVSCEGYVNVTNVNGNYRYTPILDCGDDYKTTSLKEYIISNEDVVESGSGLYAIDGGYAFRGENVNNYVKFGENNYRIVKIVGDNVVLMYDGKVINMVWDDRYNIDKKSEVGINDYSVSRVNEYLQQLYNGEELFTNEEKLLLSSHDVSVGKRKENDTGKSNTSENKNVFQNQYISLITLSDFLYASLDSNCTSSTSVTCINYNYFMDNGISFWTVTADSKLSHKVFKIDSSNGSILVNASSSAGVAPVIHLVSDAIYVEGDGSLTNPYIFK